MDEFVKKGPTNSSWSEFVLSILNLANLKASKMVIFCFSLAWFNNNIKATERAKEKQKITIFEAFKLD